MRGELITSFAGARGRKLANCAIRMKAVLALAMGAAALAPSQPKVRNEARRVNRGRCGGIAILLIKPAGDVLGGPCASRRLSSLAACCAQHKSDGTDAFQGLNARERRELSDTGRAAPDTNHAAAAGSGTPTVPHTHRAALSSR